MTDFVIQANETSTLLRDLNDKGRLDLSYAIKPSYPILSKNLVSITAETSSATAGATLVFKLPRAGLLRNLLIQSTVTAATANLAAGVPWGLRLFESIEIRTNNKVIYTQSDYATVALSQHAPSAKAMAIYRRAMSSSTLGVPGAAAATVMYTPIFSPFLESDYNCIDLAFWEPISVHCKMNTGTRMGVTNTSVLTISSPTMWIWTYSPDLEYYNKLKSANMVPGKPLNMLGYNTFLEKYTCTATGLLATPAPNIMKLNVNYPVIAMYISVRSNATPGVNVAITSFEFSVAGRKLYESVPWLVGDYEADCSGSAGLVLVSDATAVTRASDIDRVRWLQFNMDPYDKTYNSGAMSFNNLLNPTLTVYTGSDVSGGTFDINVVYVYEDIITFDPSNGQVFISNST